MKLKDCPFCKQPTKAKKHITIDENTTIKYECLACGGFFNESEL